MVNTNPINRTPIPVFVYGTLRPGEGNYGWALEGNTVAENTGYFDNASMYTNGGFPYVLEGEGDGVTGTLVDIDPKVLDEVMRGLDSLEGTHTGEEVPGKGKQDDANHYNRVLRAIRMEDGSTVNAWVYIPPSVDYDLIRDRCRFVEDGDWMTGRYLRNLSRMF